MSPTFLQRNLLDPDPEAPVVKEEAEDLDDDDGVDPKVLQEDIEDWEKCNRIGEKHLSALQYRGASAADTSLPRTST